MIAMPSTEPKPEAPSCLLLKGDRTAEIAVLGEERCLCLFTDPTLMGPYYASRYGGLPVSGEVPTLWFKGPDELRAFLRSNEAELATQGVRHLAVNPAPNRDIRRVPIKAYLDAGIRVE
jgi:hypothetical protein